MRRTKIIATMGPATDRPEMLEHMVEAGVDLFRINYSHQTHLEHKERAQTLKEISASPRYRDRPDSRFARPQDQA